MSAALQKQDEEMKAIKRRNSRLAAEANKIKKGGRKQYETPAAGKKGGNRETHRCMPVTKHRVADQHTCHVCRTRLGNATETRPRILEDMELGRWEVIRHDVTGRWCPGCKRLQSTIPGAGPKQRFGNRALAMLSFLKMIGVSFRKIGLVFMVFYMVHISKKAIQEAVRTVSGGIMHQYEAVHRHILKEASVNGDETAWRVTGLLYWVWCVLGDDAVWFNIQEGRGTPEAREMLPEYEGMVTSDSHAPWNHVGREHQKCHLHYRRELKKTMQENKNPEFQAFAARLNQMLWDSHDTKKGYGPDDDPQTRKRKQRNLMRRLACLMEKDYTDRDCKRFLKRLRRGFHRLFSHVMYGVYWHNNKAERAVRCFVLLRHVMFGNRTEFDTDTYAVLLSIILRHEGRQPPGIHDCPNHMAVRSSCPGPQQILNNTHMHCSFRHDPSSRSRLTLRITS